jgi:hypothetical protein
MGARIRALCAFAALMALAVGVTVALPGSSASADGGLTFTIGDFPPDTGVVRLRLGDQDTFTYQPAGGTAVTQSLPTPSNCNLPNPLALSTVGVTLSGAPAGGQQQGKLGFFDDGLGVQVKGEGNGSPCGQVSGTQKLTLALSGALAGKRMDFVEVDVEGKFGVTLKAQLYLGTSSTPVKTEIYATGGPDSGPDSVDGDNFRVRVPKTGTVLFDRIVLSVDESTPGGAFSLEGGADGTMALEGGYAATKLGGTTDSIFHITDASLLECGESTPTVGGGTSPAVSVTLLEEGCTEGIPYSLTTEKLADGQQGILFQKDAEGTSQFRSTFTWAVEEAAYPVPATKIDFTPNGGLADAEAMQWCEGTYASPQLPSAGDVTWCLVKHTAVVQSPTEVGGKRVRMMQITEEVYGLGDPFSFR